ncbi:carbohydrate-binding protein [Aquimarina sp. RZ0]|uniref:carbohydrate-binding protein n=1 Tax=Aquimarina sp. RZ0 TaxID=2607730 RepID=UPI0011F0F12E|nr:carbohydrate-binding protein [Aquimarina sp. RZ0]KAA1242809.1 carbohydrate-binding protein [Aquimarina sp. RZ0]
MRKINANPSFSSFLNVTNAIKKYGNYRKVLILSLPLFFISLSLQAKDIYVAKNGNDSNDGTQNAPFKTIAKASSVAQAGDIVIIGEGTYEELLEPARSGTPGNPIVYRAKTGEKVIITAMQAVNNWTVDQGNIYKATVNWDLGQDNMALHDDNLMDLARWPNNVPQNLFERDYLPACNRGAAGGGKTWMNYDGSQSNGHANSIPHASKWKNGGSIHFYGGAGFLAWTDFITNSSSNRIDFKLERAQNWIQLRHHPGYTGHGVKKGEFFLQGIKEALDYKNEWFYDKNNKTLYVQIDGGGAPANNSIRFRRRTQTIKLNKNYIHIENLAVFGGSIDISGNNNKLSRVSSFYGNHTLGVINGFDSRRQSVLMTGNKNTIEQCEIAWGAGNGVYDQGDDNKLLNSYVHDFNYLGNYDCVLNTRGAKRGSYKNNTLTRSGKDIIQAYVDGGEYAYNDVSLNNFVADDGGLLYTTNARATKSSIHHNTFHDSQARNGRFKGTGVYLDNDSKNWDVYNNVVWNTKWTNIQINWNGTNLKIYNNTFAKGSATMGAWHKEGTSFSNVQVWNNITDKESTDQGGNQEDESTWDEQTNRQNNLISKESFVNWENNNYQLKAGSEAVDHGRVIDGFTDGYQGNSPDAGAYEFGVAPFQTGIDWDITSGPTGLGCYGLPGEHPNCTSTCTNPTTWYQDADDDDLGDPSQTMSSCSQPAGYVANSDDECPSDTINTCTIVHNIPGTVEAEEYFQHFGIQRETTADTGGGMNIGFIEDGDFSEYQISAPAAGSYNIALRVASDSQGGTVRLVRETVSLGTINIDNTGGWQNWNTVNIPVDLNQGNQKIRFEYAGGNDYLFNINYFEFSNPLLSVDEFTEYSFTVYPNPAQRFITIDGIKEDSILNIRDITGKKLKTITITPNTPNKINISSLTEGMYWLIDPITKSVQKFIKY